MKEAQLIRAVSIRLPKSLYDQSMTGTIVGGTPDRYYDGSSDLWVEYKVIESMPRSGTWSVFPLPNVKKQPRGKLTMLQYNWLLRRYTNGGNAIVVVGLPTRKALLLTTPSMWREEVEVARARSLEDIAAWIQDYCGG